MPRYDLIVVGASWGGLFALRDLLAGLPDGFRTPIAIAQHRSPESTHDAFVDLLGHFSPVPVTEASDKEPIEPGHVYVAPPDYHLLVEQGRFALSTEAKVRFSRPSIDVLFESAADAYGSQVAGVILTGSNADGARGLQAIQRRGGLAIVQDPATAERSEMPRAALDAVPSARVLALEDIAPVLTEAVGTTTRAGA